MHPRNRHHSRYDFKQLISSSLELAPFVMVNKYGDESVDFANPDAVKSLNQALLKSFYGLTYWDIPPNYLCPPIPGRADYIHYVADLLGPLARGQDVVVLDVGVGANCVYPLIGLHEYGWHFIGSDIDEFALANAGEIIKRNSLEAKIELRQQKSAGAILKGIINPGELIDLTLCNPPFHRSAEAAAEGSQRKLRNLGIKEKALNFGGKSNELWCPGGEEAFIGTMIEESRALAKNCLWFTSLVSKKENLANLERQAKKAGATEVRVIEMSQGQKVSRVLAWTYLDPKKWKQK